jgi:P pilus assembly chaperone PapD
VNLAADGTVIVEAPNEGSLLQGYAGFALLAGVSGYGVFRQSVAGRADQEAVVPFSAAVASSNTLTWDENNLITAVAISNPSSTATTVAVTLWDESGNVIGNSSIPLAPNSKTETTLRTLPGLSGMMGQRGSAQFSVSQGSVAVLGLRFNGPAFTSIPTTSGSPSNPASSILPQFAFGGGWYSALYFTNVTGSPVSFPVSFVSDAGMPLTVPALGGATTQVNLAAHGTAIIEAPNVGSLLQGYAEFSLPRGVYGYGVFRQSVAGRPDQEAVVPFSAAGATSNTLTWDETNLITAVAVGNPSATATTVGVTLWDENGNVIGTSSIPLAAGAKTEATLRTLPGLSAMVGQRGSAQFTVSAGSVAVLGLRFDGPALTSIPTANLPAATAGADSRPTAEVFEGNENGELKRFTHLHFDY